MQIARRRLTSGEPDFELICLTISLGALALAALWFTLRMPWPTCAFHALTGHPCGTCGATRSAIAFFHGQFGSSLGWNPLAFAFYAALSLFDAYAFFAVVRGTPRLRIALSTRETSFLGRAAIALFAANWIYLLIANPGL